MVDAIDSADLGASYFQDKQQRTMEVSKNARKTLRLAKSMRDIDSELTIAWRSDSTKPPATTEVNIYSSLPALSVFSRMAKRGASAVVCTEASFDI